MKFKKIIFWNLIILISTFGLLEIFARNFFPEFKNRESYSLEKENLIYGKILNKNFFKKKYKNIWISRVINENHKFDYNNKDLFIVLGDSITNGFGMPYEDIYWVKMQKKVLLDKRINNNIEFLALSDYGNNLNDSIKTINDIKDDFNSSIKYIMYQFNFNDLIPLELQGAKNPDKTKFKKLLAQIKYSSLEKSVFFNWFVHYIGASKRYLENCENGSSSLLNSYSFTFGSKGFESLSQKAWKEFENQIKKLSIISKNLDAELFIFISPILYDIDNKGIHKYHSPKYINYGCATINPREKINKISEKLNIKVLDPKEYLKKGFDSYLKENNFQPFFYTADPNHFNNKSSEYIADYLYFNIFTD
ncbi:MULTISPECIES: hypothetical protein [Prochlorococcus]|uniref:SGNH hydrolase-type esterase domain-containing protein n=1 Tax=Prochlorococcus marinus str. MIT 9314 TaxID=167548 RepID=A0A0A2AI86_PROMR|nr:hypothetical protein [Prochlorococcus marinus]KGG00240.1 hypothetical protein EU98_1772 [Prochlorococcus marinus str. MIT 9314]